MAGWGGHRSSPYFPLLVFEMTYNDLSEKDKRYFAKFRRIADMHGVKDEQGVRDVVQMLSSPQMKSIPLIAFLVAIVCGFFAGEDIANGDIPIFTPVLCVIFLWIGAQNLRNITTTIPMIADVYAREELPKKQKVSKKKRQRLEKQAADHQKD